MKLTDKIKKIDEKYYDEKQIADQKHVYSIGFSSFFAFVTLYLLLCQCGVPFTLRSSAVICLLFPMLCFCFAAVYWNTLETILPNRVFDWGLPFLTAIMVPYAIRAVVLSVRKLIVQDLSQWPAEKWTEVTLDLVMGAVIITFVIFYFVRHFRYRKAENESNE